jgi:putative transposase
MRKLRVFVDGATYHVTSRANNKLKAFESHLGRTIMLLTLEEAKERYGFCLYNFCIMPTHIHLLIKPADGSNLSKIMQWIKTHSAKRWNFIHGSTDHLWGDRFFHREIKDMVHYFVIDDYINQNPVKAGLCKNPQDWEESGSYHVANDIQGLVDKVTDTFEKVTDTL